MALSQVQCLDDNHVNPRTHESKPEFLYCEDQRLALEAFLRDGREAFGKYLCAHGLRGFLSDPELETLADLVEPYDPGSELFFPENAEDDEPPLSLHYWPELSDTSVPQMDLSWPDNVSYRGVTRTTVYTQPPLEGQVHIKEVVRKMIAQAQKVIAVVMDVFTDVDIFRDLLDAGFKRKVSVYILLERTTLPHFQSMCQRANMHAGHLKNLRVRCTDGADFCSRSCTKVRGRMGHRFMFIDGDKAVSGSYSFTWMSSRLDRNLITVVTGQAVEAFDRLFCVLYATSSAVDLRQVATEPEPEPEPVPAPVPVAATSADIARRMYSPRYAMLALSSPTPSADPKETQDPQNSKNPETKKGRRKASKEPVQEDPPLHPGLTNLEKVCMMSYLPTWPEPDPASDVIGFINIRDNKKTNQNHLQRSEMFETSQAIRFSSPFSMPKEILPEVAELRQITPQHGAANKVQPAQTKAKEAAVVGGANPAQLTAVPVNDSKAEATGPKPPGSGPKWDSNATETLNAENTRRSNAPADQDAGPPLPSTTPLPGPNAEREAQRDALQVEAEPQNSCDVASSARSPTANSTSSTSTSVSSLSGNSHVSATTSRTASASSPSSSSSIPPLPSSSATPNPPLTSASASESSTPPPPVPKPRTVQLIMKGGVGAGEGQKLPEFSVLTKPGTSTGVLQEPEDARKDADGPSGIGTYREADGRHQGAAAGSKMSDVLITEAPKAESLNIQEIIPTDVEHKTLMPTDCESTPRIERVEVTAPGPDPAGCPSPAEPNGKRESASESKTYLARAHVAQRISYSELTLKDTHASEATDALKAPVSSSDASRHGEDPQGRPGFAPNAVKIPKARASTHTADRPVRLHLSDAPVLDFRTPTPDRESRLLSALARSPTPDGFLPRTPTPDSRTHTPDLRTPTSDGYISPRTDSTNSEEYYECNDSFHELLFDRAFLRNPGTEDYIGFTQGSNPNATTSGVKDRSAFVSETESSSGLPSVSSLSSLKGKMDENGGGEDERGESVAEGGYQRGSEDVKRRADHFKQAEAPTGTEEQNKEAQAPKRKRGLSQSAAEKPVDAGEPANERTAPQRVDLQPGKSSSERKRPDKEKGAARGALGPSGAERRDTEGQKPLHALPKSPRDREASSPSRPPRPPRPLSITQALAPRPWVSRQPNQAESKVLHDSVRSAERTSSPRRPPSRAASPGPAGRKQDDAAHSQQGPVSPSQGRTRAGPPQTQRPFPKPEASQSQAEEAHWQEEGKSPFSLTVSRLYSLKGLKALKDKVSKGGGASSPAAGRKSTS